LAALRLRAVAFLAAGLRARLFFRAVLFLAVDFLAAGLRAAVFRRAVLFFAVDFLAVDLFAIGLRAAVFRRVVVFLAVDFLAVDLRALLFFRAVLLVAAAMVSPLSGPSSGRHTLQASTFPFAHPAPDAVPLVAAQRVVEALDPNGTLTADPLGLPR